MSINNTSMTCMDLTLLFGSHTSTHTFRSSDRIQSIRDFLCRVYFSLESFKTPTVQRTKYIFNVILSLVWNFGIWLKGIANCITLVYTFNSCDCINETVLVYSVCKMYVCRIVFYFLRFQCQPDVFEIIFLANVWVFFSFFRFLPLPTNIHTWTVLYYFAAIAAVKFT